MRVFGVLVAVCGAVFLVVALSMDTSVATGLGRVNNIGLMNDKQNYVIIASVMILAGLIIIAFDRTNHSQTISDLFDELESQSRQQELAAQNDRKRYAIELGIQRLHGLYM